MDKESEIEEQFCIQLERLGFKKIDKKYNNINDLEGFTRSELEKLNLKDGSQFTDDEWNGIKSWISKNDISHLDKMLDDAYLLKRSNESIQVWLLKKNNDLYKSSWCENSFTYISQFRFGDNIDGNLKYRSDVILFINGLPIIMVELKKNDTISLLSEKGAFFQIQNYKKEFGGTLLEYIQLFVIANKSKTYYFANNKELNKEFCFEWTDKENKKITRLFDFTENFLKPHRLYDIIRYYTIVNIEKEILVMRPYQIYAVESIIEKVKGGYHSEGQRTDNNGFIWHTTGSGKTLTSFKTSQILVNIPEISKVIFVVDRNDLDFQTRDEFNRFEKDCVDSTENTNKLRIQLKDSDSRLIVTTIHKLNRLLSNDADKSDINFLREQRVILIFDECHRSQFGAYNQNITKFFKKAQLFGFTGTPIFADNAIKNSSTSTKIPYLTKDIFGKILHTYTIKDAINDTNVLAFQREYFDSKVEKNIDYNHKSRIDGISKLILENHYKKTYNNKYNAIFATSSIKSAILYYETLKEMIKNSDDPNIKKLNIATIFSYNSELNTEDKENGLVEDTGDIEYNSVKYKLESYMQDFNETFKTNHSLSDAASFNAYRDDISKKVKNARKPNEPKIDILIVASMFLTGFDSKALNTIYVDKNLEYHGLIQAISRTNRVYNEQKKYGQVVLFRDLRENFDKAVTLFSNSDSVESVQNTLFRPEFSTVKAGLEKAIKNFKYKFNDITSIENIQGDMDRHAFVNLFNPILKTINEIKTYSEYDEDTLLPELGLEIQDYEDIIAHYKDIAQEIKPYKENDSDKDKIEQDDYEFHLELLEEVTIDVDYIIQLLIEASEKGDKKVIEKCMIDLKAQGESEELVRRFIDSLKNANNESNLHDKFSNFKKKQFKIEITDECQKYNIDENTILDIVKKSSYRKKKVILTIDNKYFKDRDSKVNFEKNIFAIIAKYKGDK